MKFYQPKIEEKPKKDADFLTDGIKYYVVTSHSIHETHEKYAAILFSRGPGAQLRFSSQCDVFRLVSQALLFFVAGF